MLHIAGLVALLVPMYRAPLPTITWQNVRVLEQPQTWEKGYQFEHHMTEGRAIKHTPDGGYIVAGFAYINWTDAYLAKIDACGTLQWSQVYGGELEEHISDVVVAADGGYAIVGDTRSFGTPYRSIYVVKTTENGTVEWEGVYGTELASFGNALLQTEDGGFLVAGYTGSAGSYRAYLLKIDANGVEQWSQKYFKGQQSFLKSIERTADGGYVFGGNVWFNTGWQAYLLKTDGNGQLEWHTTFGGDEVDHCVVARQTPEGGYICFGNTSSYGDGTQNYYVVKTFDDGSIDWEQVHGTTGIDAVWSAQLTADGGYIVGGHTSGIGSYNHYYVLKLASNGGLEWERFYGNNTGGSQAAHVIQTADGGYIMTGGSYAFPGFETHCYTIKTDALGQVQPSGAAGPCDLISVQLLVSIDGP